MSGALSILEQRFSTLPVSIVGQGVALYALSIREPGGSGPPVPGLTYIFPMSPQGVRKETAELYTLYDVQGPPYSSSPGVTRLVDIWGEAPPIYVLRGTTGWSRHSTDGFALSGKDSIEAVQDLLSQFAYFNQVLLQQNATDFYTLEFYDYWMNEFWEVVPVGPQGIDQTSDKPLLSYYTFRLACIKALDAPINPLLVDLTVSLLSAGAQAATTAFTSFTSNILGVY